jgi:hypothetical protein
VADERAGGVERAAPHRPPGQDPQTRGLDHVEPGGAPSVRTQDLRPRLRDRSRLDRRRRMR